MSNYNNAKEFIKYKKNIIFKNIDDIDKAYWLGLIAAKGEFNKKMMTISITMKNDESYLINILVHLFDEESGCIHITNFYNKVIVNIVSVSVYIDICNLLKINIYDSSDDDNKNSLSFPKLENNGMMLYFTKGYFDSLCFISNNKFPTCHIEIKSRDIIDNIVKFLQIPCRTNKNNIIYGGMNVIDLFGKLFSNVKRNNLYSKLKYKLFVEILNNNKNFNLPVLPKCKVLKANPDAIIPYKKNLSDVGYDITIISHYKKVNDNLMWPCNEFFCIKIEFIIRKQKLLGGGTTVSIHSILEKSNTHLNKFVNTSLIASKQTTNNFEL
jgi:hypothetical protein